MDRRSGFMFAATIALLWALVPAIPALGSGGLVGAPFTDLYPSAWGMQVLADAWPNIPLSTTRLGAPAGIGFYYSSPIHGWLGAPFTLALGPAFSYNATLIVARWATVFCTFGWLRAEGRGDGPAIAGALLYGASPFFNGYANEGIVEGTDGWALPLWAWMVATDRKAGATVAFALCMVSSWYLGMVACGVAAVFGLQRRNSWWSALGGLALASPALYAFVSAFGGNSALDDAVRVAMSAKLAFATPWFAGGRTPFAINTFVGFSAVLLALPSARSRPALAVLAAGCFLLSLGRGPWYELPPFSLVRFPYRWHAGTLFALAGLVAETLDSGAFFAGRPWRAAALGTLSWLEGLLLGPIHPILPVSRTELPAAYRNVRPELLLELPGPVALPPGKPNRSRARARWILWAQTVHHARSPWTLDFNGISRDKNAAWLASFSSWDPIFANDAPALPAVGEAKAAGVTQILVHTREYGKRWTGFAAALAEAGAKPTPSDSPDIVLYEL